MLMRHPSRGLDISSAENNVVYGGSAQEVSEERILLTGLEIILVLFCQRRWLLSCPCPKSLSEAKLKSSELISLAEEILQGS